MKLKILIAPLDWGLGHTTRCFPIIHYLNDLGHEVIVATEGISAQLVQKNFPNLKVIPLKGYRIHYSKKSFLFKIKIALQIPKILNSIRREKKWLEKIQKNEQFDLILSDNRYGLNISDASSIILTHQLNIQTGFGQFFDSVLRRIHYYFLSKFHATWIVDLPNNGGLSGKLAHPIKLPSNASYLGILSQFSMQEKKEIIKEKKNTILFLLSGTEPLRTQLEQLIFNQIASLSQYEVIVVAGHPHSTLQKKEWPTFVKYYPFLEMPQLFPLMQQASLIVCRSGYSSLMDLVCMQKKALLIPTPGQTEQEYLADYLSSKKYFYAVSQFDVNLQNDIAAAFQYDGFLSGDSIPSSLFDENLIQKQLHAVMKKMQESS